ncbi:Putative Structural maintenance of chromosomes protein [Rhizopus microsporus]|nr:Putative Structural maintenance of chromosomes protein [Rhizopus microsporus]
MIATVEKDKQKIEDTISTLENYKLEALEKTYTKVNKDFAEIFGDLLAGNTCKLQPPEGKTISDGLEVKVCLGGVWKQSLTELSGGQRSLIALSLILSLLQFKPAPMYILDEVDAALDLSHTQNIGSLLRTRFKGSQFLVVSLKDGMFNNANVLFKTRFKDGTSVVERTTPYRQESAEQQMSLLSMFKPIPTTNKETDKQEDRDPKEFFKDVDKETLELLDLEIRTMNKEWLKVLAPEMVKPYFLKVKKLSCKIMSLTLYQLKRYLKDQVAAKKTIFPPLDQVYSWSNYTPPSQVKVVILGQDPYHNFNQAHGLCFSVIKGVKVPPSLVNMYKALQTDYPLSCFSFSLINPLLYNVSI